MSISRITRTVAAGALALGVVGALAPAAVAAPAAPRAAAVCVSTPPAPVNLARNSWTQQLIFQVCDDGSTWTIKAHVLMKPQLNLGYKPANVTNCTAHQELHHIGGSTSDKAVNGSCTDVARRPQGGNSIPDAIWTGVGPGKYTLSGWVNVDTAAPGVYTGDEWASTVSLDLK